MSEPDSVVEARRWLRYADDDLRTARELQGTSAPARQVCFLAQQAAEKALKAVFVFLQIELPRSHDLEALLTLLPPGWAVRTRGLDLAALSEWAVEARYPGDWPQATAADAEAALTLADEVSEALKVDFEARGLTL
jgi:HEPN domain-containing protein